MEKRIRWECEAPSVAIRNMGEWTAGAPDPRGNESVSEAPWENGLGGQWENMFVFGCITLSGCVSRLGHRCINHARAKLVNSHLLEECISVSLVQLYSAARISSSDGAVNSRRTRFLHFDWASQKTSCSRAAAGHLWEMCYSVSWKAARHDMWVGGLSVRHLVAGTEQKGKEYFIYVRCRLIN